jgi:hypothetical protein
VLSIHTIGLYLCPTKLVLKFSAISILSIIQPNAIIFSSNSIECDFLLKFNEIQHSLEIQPYLIFSWNSPKSKISVGIQPNAVLSSEIQSKANFSLGI